MPGTNSPLPSQAQDPVTPDALHKDFSWLHPSLIHDPQARFLEKVHDISRGLNLCLQLVAGSNLTRLINRDVDPGEEEAPLLDLADTETMLSFAKAAAGMLTDDAFSRIERLNRKAEGNHA